MPASCSTRRSHALGGQAKHVEADRQIGLQYCLSGVTGTYKSVSDVRFASQEYYSYPTSLASRDDAGPGCLTGKRRFASSGYMIGPDTVDEIHPAFTLRTLSYRNYGMFPEYGECRTCIINRRGVVFSDIGLGQAEG